jgi:TPR repeat protein
MIPKPSFRSRAAALSLAVAALCAIAIAPACGTKNVGSKLAPKQPNATDALGASVACTDAKVVVEPYVVDLRGAERSHLEASMTEGIALVRYDCNGLEVLKGCSVKGASPDPYTFVGVSIKEDQVQIETLDQLKANLPASAVKLEGELTSGASIDIGLLMIGRKSVPTDAIAREDLSGPGCEGATHFVRSAIVGAFVVDKGTQGKARVAAEIFKAGASAGSEANQRVANKDGKPDDCQVAKPGDKVPPDQCRAAITIELYPIAEERPVVADAEQGGAPKPEQEKAQELVTKCQPGFVRAEGKCTPPAQVKAHQCKPGDFADCEAQCTNGDSASCYNYGLLLRFGSPDRAADKDKAAKMFLSACDAEDGPGEACREAAFPLQVEKQWGRYTELMQRGCDRGDAGSCDSLGSTLTQGRPPELPKDVKRGIALLESACGMGRQWACSTLATSLIREKVDAERGLSLLERSCDRGGIGDCGQLAFLYGQGQAPGGKSPTKALEYEVKACDLGAAFSCGTAGKKLVEAKGVKRDLDRAHDLFVKGCPAPDPSKKFMSMSKDACVGLAEMHMTGKGASKAPAKAEEILQRGCADRNNMTCVELSAFYAKGAKGIPKDDAKAEKILRDACDRKDPNSCTELGKQLEKNDLGIARAFYEDACARTKFPPLCNSAERLGGKSAVPSGPPSGPPPPKPTSGPPKSGPPSGPPPAKKGG